MQSASSATKNCPQCRSLLAADARGCVCGYRYTEAAEAVGPITNLLAQAEELYETHLRARLQRAIRAVKLAKVDLLRDPGNLATKGQLREAENEVKLLEAQITVQTARVADAHAPETFRAAQAAKAEQSLERTNLELATERLRANHATAVFKATQAEKALDAEHRTANDAIQTCPDCGLPVAAGVARCDCGYRLQGPDIGTDFLSADEMAALRGH